MKSQHTLYAGLCTLFLLTAAMCCEEGAIEEINEISNIELLQYDNSGEYPVVIENDQCPKEAYLIRITPIYEVWSDINILKSPIIAFRIITLTDFNEDYPAGSDIYNLFKEYPAILLGENFNSPANDSLQEGEPITSLGTGSFYKVLLTHPQSGTYQFRVELEMKDGSLVSKETAPVLLY